MAKKLTKAQIAKNPTKAINSGKMKMKKQEVPLAGIGKAAARLVGKAVVNATTGKYAARNYVESSMRADAKKAAAKKSAKSVKEALKNAKKSKPLANPKSAVRVKPAAKQRPNKPDDAKVNYKVNDSGGRAYNKAAREYEEGAGRHGNMYEMQAEARDAMFRAPVGRKTSIQGKKLFQAEARKATNPRPTKDIVNSNVWEKRIKINSAPKKSTAKKAAPKKKSK